MGACLLKFTLLSISLDIRQWKNSCKWLKVLIASQCVGKLPMFIKIKTREIPNVRLVRQPVVHHSSVYPVCRETATLYAFQVFVKLTLLSAHPIEGSARGTTLQQARLDRGKTTTFRSGGTWRVTDILCSLWCALHGGLPLTCMRTYVCGMCACACVCAISHVLVCPYDNESLDRHQWRRQG